MRMNKKYITLIPVLIFLGLIALVVIPLIRGDDPTSIKSVLIDKPVPAFTRPEFSSTDLKGRVTLVNFFASWCPPCEAENDTLLKLKADRGIVIYGINYKDNSGSRRDYLTRLGNPYAAVTPDPNGQLAILWGTYGVPETFVIDAQGRIRYRHSAPLTAKDVDEILIPLMREIQQ
jgi:cytochrome c biogenesis protein CcmG/thiol:disulfide interchange protein DsbE